MNPDYAKQISEVCESLRSQVAGKLRQYDFEGEPGEYRVAFSIIEIAESAEKLVRLAAELRSKDVEAEETLSKFRDELSHILYHVRDSGFFADVLDFE